MTSEFAIAVHSLVYLHHRGEMVSSEVLAQNVCTNPARVRKVLSCLKKAGLVATREGNVGGYRLCCPAEKINLRQVDEAVQGRLVSASWRSGRQDQPCMISSGMAEVMDDIYNDLDALCRRRLEETTILDVYKKILHRLPEGASLCGGMMAKKTKE